MKERLTPSQLDALYDELHFHQAKLTDLLMFIHEWRTSTTPRPEGYLEEKVVEELYCRAFGLKYLCNKHLPNTARFVLSLRGCKLTEPTYETPTPS
jgi:hypothetical protein